ncbi:MAG TPA: hypothetical protein VEY08_09300 [Chloroflexia bacterium]|nr:hypothetical protein [Chloroflexia bacterium]
MINQNEPEGKMNAAAGPESAPVALLFCADLMFAVQLQNMARKSGYRVANARPGAPLPGADVLVVDLGSRGDWEGAVREMAGRGVPVIAFGPHMDAEGRKRAKAAGASRVLANSNLTRDLPRILTDLRER